jgi:tRNA threonylcarbamoyladenosine biosynthesis protein TsaB
MILAIDTATSATVVGVAAPDGALLAAGRHDPAPGERPGHGPQLLALAARALEEAGVPWAAITRIGAGAGPGTFTGLRIGIATVRALAQGLDAEVVAVSSLGALALAARDGEGPVLAAIDARRGEAYVAAFGADGTPLLAPAAWGPERLAGVGDLAPGRWRAVGDGALRFRADLEAVGVTVAADDSSLHRVSAEALCRLAAEGPTVPRDALVPEYVRAPDAIPRRP